MNVQNRRALIRLLDQAGDLELAAQGLRQDGEYVKAGALDLARTIITDANDEEEDDAED